MPADMTPYVIRQGDHLARLAFRYGFDPDAVWVHPSNAELRTLRKDPCVLAPGDVLYMPVATNGGLPFTPGKTNRYVARAPHVDVHLIIHDQLGEPLPDEPYFIEGLAAATEWKTAPDGAASFAVPVHMRELTLFFTRRNVRLAVRVGDMDPQEEPSGVAARLANLRFLDGPTGWTEEQLAEAMTAFQRVHGLPATGALDEDTRNALRSVHSGQSEPEERTP